MAVDGPRYDDIVVGAGTSGSVVAARLSERTDRSVLLLEAGPTFPNLDGLPAHLLGRDENPWIGAEHNWILPARLTRWDTQSRAITRGRVLGGSGAVNGGIHVRATPSDFDGWGDGRWGWADVLDCYRRSEEDVDFGDRPYHGSHGPVPVRRAVRQDYSALYTVFESACDDAGHERCADLNSPGAQGQGPLPKNFRNGLRESAAMSYLLPILHRDNLTVVADAPVSRVVFDGTRACAVDVGTGADARRYRADRIVLCAGALLTPTILLRSGLGPLPVLDHLGIEAVRELAGVGEGLHDHPTVHIELEPRAAGAVPTAGRPGRMQTALLLTTGLHDTPTDIQIMPTYRAGRLALTVMLNRSLSTGAVRLPSADPEALPVVEFDYLSRPEDRDAMRAGVREALRLARSSALQEIGRADAALPASTASDEELDSWILRSLSSAAHSSGTCAMGERGTGAVVDACGAVHGVDDLSVADISIIPVPLRNNTNATALMTAERVAALLTEEVAR